MQILVTGVSGFVGCALLPRLVAEGHVVRAAGRTPSAFAGVANVQIGNIGAGTDWAACLRDIDCVVHLAAHLHQTRRSQKNSIELYHEVNSAGTAQLAKAAAMAGVRRMVFLSTAKVYGEKSEGRPFSERDLPCPEDPYAISKLEAEQQLGVMARHTGLQPVIIRPPLVYGPGVKANFLRLLRWVERGYPLPFAAVNNRRSFISVSNLADAIALCVQAPMAGGKTFVVSDQEDLSTADLIRRLAQQLQRAPRLVSMPSSLLRGIARLAGLGEEMERLLSDLAVDSRLITDVLGWRPPQTVDQALGETVRWYRAEYSRPSQPSFKASIGR